MIYQNEQIYIEWHEADIPWIKVFSADRYRELTDAPQSVRDEIWRVVQICERELISLYEPTKINIASFGNYLPHLHIHIMARFEEDSHYPESMWGAKQREGIEIDLKKEQFEKRLRSALGADQD